MFTRTLDQHLPRVCPVQMHAYINTLTGKYVEMVFRSRTCSGVCFVCLLAMQETCEEWVVLMRRIERKGKERKREEEKLVEGWLPVDEGRMGVGVATKRVRCSSIKMLLCGGGIRRCLALIGWTS